MISMKDLVNEYVQLRNAKKEAEEKAKSFIRDSYLNRMEAIEGEILNFFNTTNQDNAKTEYGTASRVPDVSATIADATEFRRYVIGSESWELIDWRANKTAVREIVDETGAPPPGVNFTRSYKIQIRKAS
jgi:hypothetical protein